MLAFAVIGHPVAHSLSPRMHAEHFRAIAFDATYGAFDIAPGDLDAALARFASEGYRGLNVTVPHKVAVAARMTRLDASAARTGAVNTVRFEADGTTTGFNTDVGGFLDALAAAGFAVSGRRVLLLGAGGAARAVAVGCLDAGCAQLTVANRTPAKAEALAQLLADGRVGTAPFEACADDPACRAADLVVNATTVGLRADDPSVLPASFFRPGQTVCDIMPVARETATLAAARAAGAVCVDGLGMLAAQAARSFTIWTGLQSAYARPQI